MKQTTTIALAVIVISSLAFGQRGMMRDGPMWDDDLNLTQEQQETIADLRAEFQKARIDDHAALQKLRLEQWELMRSDNPDQKAINRTIERIKEREAQMEQAWVTHHLAIRNTLNEEQRAIFDNRPMGRGFGHHGPGFSGEGMGMGPGAGMGNCGGQGGPGSRHGRR